jgi:hypothetical protein
MSSSDIRDVEVLQFLQNRVPPPMSASLLAAVRSPRPVRTRAPFRSLLVLTAAAFVFPFTAFVMYPLRADLAKLPPLWVTAVALVWLTGFVVPLAYALLPARGQVLPNGAGAGRAAVLASLTLVLVGLLFTVDAPGFTLLPKTTWAGFGRLWWHCVSFGLKVSVPTILVAAVLLRWVAITNAWRLGAGVGAAAGSLAGLTLHGLCPYGGAVHVGLAHGGGVVVGAILGAIWLPILIRPFRSGA